MNRKRKKKKVKEHLAKKRGMKKTKKKIPQARSKKVKPEVLNNMLLSTLLLAGIEELRDIEFDNEKLTAYLESEKKLPEQKPIDFIRKGIRTVLTPAGFKEINDRLIIMLKKKETHEQILIAIDGYFRILAMGIAPEFIPLFIHRFANQIKKHPLADNPKIWKYISDFVPKRIVSSKDEEALVTQKIERQKEDEEKRDENYPHIILPK